MNVDKLTKISMLTALTVVLSILFIFPVPGTKGFVNLSEVGIYIAAQLLGGTAGLFVGGLSGGIIDILAGYPEWMLFSILIHGLQGFVVGKFAEKNRSYLGLLLGSCLMVIGYFFAGWFLYGWAAALPSIPTNIVQNILGILISTPILVGLKQTKKRKKVF